MPNLEWPDALEKQGDGASAKEGTDKEAGESSSDDDEDDDGAEEEEAPAIKIGGR